MTVVLLATDAYGGHGGIALFNRELTAALAERSRVIVIPRIVPHQPEPTPPGVTFHPEAARSRFAYGRAIVRAAFARSDLVICGHINLLPVACGIARHPLLITHGIEAWKPPHNHISRQLLHRCRGVVSVSAITRDRLLSWSKFRGPTYILPNTVHPERYGVRQRRQDLIARFGLEGKRVLLTVGRLAGEERYKGFDEVLEILAELPPDVSYVIAGGGNDEGRLRQRAAELGVVDRVVFTGTFLEQDKPDIYNLADLYVMPSRGEGFGFVFLEALASGLPVIGSKYDGGREALMDGKLGLLVDPSNPAEIRRAIAELLAPGRRRIPLELEYFSFDNFKRRLAEIVTRVKS